MHLPDPTTFTFGTAIVNLAIAITAVVRLVMEKKSGRLTSKRSDSKKNISWLEQCFKKNDLRLMRPLPELQKKSSLLDTHFPCMSSPLKKNYIRLTNIFIISTSY
jgi:hypothetical protein